MKHKTLVRILCRLLGIYLFVVGISGVLTTTVVISQWIMQMGSGPNVNSRWWNLLHVISPLFSLAAGAYLFFGGAWIVNAIVPSNRPYCPDCGYDLSGAPSNPCPECGADPRNGRPA